MAIPTEVGLDVVRKVTDLWKSAKSDSLIDYTRGARVEPIVLIDTDCMYLEMMPDVMQSLQSIFAGYYLQAVAMSATIGRIDVMHHLDKLNPNRNPIDTAANSAGWLLAAENYKDRLPNAKQAIKPKLALEAINPYEGNTVDPDGRADVALGRNATADLRELASLSVGKQISVEITDGCHKANIPISIRLLASSLPSNNIVHTLSRGKEDNTVKERWHGWKSGRLSFIRDILLCRDLIDAHRKDLMQDKDNVYTNLVQRRRNNQLSTILSGNPSVATASNMVVMSTNTVEALELEINGRFKDFKTREKVFDETSLMIAVVIDKSWERVTFYHRGIAQATELSARDLKVSSKGNGADIGEIMKAYMKLTAPSL